MEELSSAAVSPRIGYYQVLWFRYAFKHGCLSNMCTWSLWRSPQERMKPKHQEQMSKRAPDDEHLFLRRKMSERQSHE